MRGAAGAEGEVGVAGKGAETMRGCGEAHAGMGGAAGGREREREGEREGEGRREGGREGGREERARAREIE